ncbi:hypothetical protein Q4E93_03055 [Flavitalea sp. BT771]|nr:hypothetical protein [Flavitalea sp. BT771]MDO6429552.1 hypothetical protein [Flavitalea sp. BT771]MDV6218320.1 hypothetical protein [Flavitalea sp. BT771]
MSPISGAQRLLHSTPESIAVASEPILVAPLFPPIALALLHIVPPPPPGQHIAQALLTSLSQAGLTMEENNSTPILQGPPP